MLCKMRLFAVGVGLVALPAVMQAPAFAEEADQIEAVFEQKDPLTEALKSKLSAKFRKRGRLARDRGALAAFYAERDYAPLWLSDNRLNSRALAAKRELANAGVYGLDPADYPTPDASAALRSSEASDSADAKALAQVELDMSHTVLTYIRHAHEGRFDQTKLSRFLDRKAKPIDAVARLSALSEAKDVAAYLADQHPDNLQFRALMLALAETAAPKPLGERIRIPRGPVLRPGITHPQVALVRRRLGMDAAEDANPKLYDDGLKEAVMAFQKENNLRAEGFVGLKTRFAMNAPKRDRRAQILANMERWRWMPRDLGATHIRVNIPEFKFRVMRDGELYHEERVIVGKPSNKTPVFSDTMEKVVFNPYWNVPQSIIWNEMGGRIPAGWQGGTRNGRRWIRQPPGPRNALGRVKFLFPNKHAVYMHDTPTKHLFDKQRRAFSHGCVRVRDPGRLAEVVMGMEGWSTTKVRREFSTLSNNQVELNKHIPVHVTYFTLWADKDGKLASFSDVYGHDNRIHAAIRKGVAYAKAKFPEVRKKRIVSRPVHSDSLFDDWFEPSTSAAYWGNTRRKAKRKRVYRRKKQQNFDNFFGIF